MSDQNPMTVYAMPESEIVRTCEQLRKDFAPVRKKVQDALKAQPKTITLKEALTQVNQIP